MARLSKHGTELARIDYVNKRIAYMSDGVVLANTGNGWKVRGTVKVGRSPTEVAAAEVARYNAKIANNPSYAAWRDLLFELVPFAHRWKVVYAISLMPSDPDGVWSEVSDSWGMGEFKGELSIDDCVALCQAHEAARLESNAKRSETTTA